MRCPMHPPNSAPSTSVCSLWHPQHTPHTEDTTRSPEAQLDTDPLSPTHSRLTRPRRRARTSPPGTKPPSGRAIGPSAPHGKRRARRRLAGRRERAGRAVEQLRAAAYISSSRECVLKLVVHVSRSAIPSKLHSRDPNLCLSSTAVGNLLFLHCRPFSWLVGSTGGRTPARAPGHANPPEIPPRRTPYRRRPGGSGRIARARSPGSP